MRPDHHQTILLIAGLAALAFVLLAFPVERDPWPFIVLIGGMLGIPAFIADARRRNGNRDADETPPQPPRKPPLDDPVDHPDDPAR